MTRRPFLDQLTATQRQACLSAGTARSYAPGAYLCLEGEPSSSVFILLDGLLRVERTTSSGRLVLLALSSPGELLGELGVLDGSSRSAALQALEPSTCLEISATAFERLLLAHPELLMLVTRSISSRVRELTDQLVQATDKDTVGRVAARLAALVERVDPAPPGSIVLRMPVSQEELGQWAGLSREATAKALHELRHAGIVSTGRRRVTVHDLSALRRLAAGAQ